MFEALAWDIRAAIFLTAIPDFDQSETAFILQRDRRALAERIEQALDQLKWRSRTSLFPYGSSLNS
jgi:hypothetical protein